MKLVAYVVDGHKVDIRAAKVTRDWMEKTPEKYAYRCLPLNIANTHGWEILCPHAFSAVWTGGIGKDAISIRTEGPQHLAPLSHFGSGVITFHVNVLFRAEEGYNLFVSGPVNTPKDGIYPLSGIVETDWSPYTFTMNWIMTRPNHEIRFEKDEPFCMIFPVRRGDVEKVEPVAMKLSSNPELKEAHDKWAASRLEFNKELQTPESKAQADKWQKLYYRGLDVEGEEEFEAHQIKLRLQEFKDET